MTRSVDDLAADVLLAFVGPHRNHHGIPAAPDGVLCTRCVAERALSELVALVGTLTQELQNAQGERDAYWGLHEVAAEWEKRAEAAEADSAAWKRAAEGYASDIERLREERAEWRWKAVREGYRAKEAEERAEAAETSLADMRRALEEIANADSKYVRDGHGFSHMIAGEPAAPKLQAIARRALAAAGPAPEETT